MTSEDKARELYNKFYSEFLQFDSGFDLIRRKKYAKKSALICVDEIIDEYQKIQDLQSIIIINDEEYTVVHLIRYWLEVKKAIEQQ